VAASARELTPTTTTVDHAPVLRSVAQVVAILTILLVYFAFPTSPLRPALAIAFLSLCPGMALVNALRLDVATSLVLGVALSLGVNMLVAESLLVSGHWSTELGLAIVAVLALAGSAIDLAQLGRRKACTP
jgi:uncharacterized membrane protein